MIQCDNAKCERRWFHWPCVSVNKAPAKKERRYCPTCREDPSKRAQWKAYARRDGYRPSLGRSGSNFSQLRYSLPSLTEDEEEDEGITKQYSSSPPRTPPVPLHHDDIRIVAHEDAHLADLADARSFFSAGNDEGDVSDYLSRHKEDKNKVWTKSHRFPMPRGLKKRELQNEQENWLRMLNRHQFRDARKDESGSDAQAAMKHDYNTSRRTTRHGQPQSGADRSRSATSIAGQIRAMPLMVSDAPSPTQEPGLFNEFDSINAVSRDIDADDALLFDSSGEELEEKEEEDLIEFTPSPVGTPATLSGSQPFLASTQDSGFGPQTQASQTSSRKRSSQDVGGPASTGRSSKLSRHFTQIDSTEGHDALWEPRGVQSASSEAKRRNGTADPVSIHDDDPFGQYGW